VNFTYLSTKINYLGQSDQILIKKAYDYAAKAHEGQTRLAGGPYIEHCLQTAAFIADLKLDAKAVAAALLHDVVEDTPYTLEQIRREFGRTIAALVDGVTKLGHIRITRQWLFIKNEKEIKEFDRQVETLRKMFMAMAKDIRVVIIKLADRLHNMKTLYAIPENKRARIAKETLEIYAPLAYRLGMGELKGQLEDLAFPYIYQEEQFSLKKKVAGRLERKEKYIRQLKGILTKKLSQAGIKAEINGRAKHMYSLWQKLKRYNGDISQIYDLVALRIVVNTIEEAYKALGIVHELWKPLSGRIKDYISMPKFNGYQSLHTTVFAEKGEIVEIQIRTFKMHDRAENGIAAHWHYTEKKGGSDYLKRQIDRVPARELRWVNELARWQKILTDNREIIDSLTMDFFSDRIFVSTPKGDVKDLPIGSTPIDFAYSIHTDIGHATVGAKVNGKMVDLSHRLENGDIIEILTKKNSKPKRDWLNFTKTSNARSKIKASVEKTPLFKNPFTKS